MIHFTSISRYLLGFSAKFHSSIGWKNILTTITIISAHSNIVGFSQSSKLQKSFKSSENSNKWCGEKVVYMILTNTFREPSAH